MTAVLFSAFFSVPYDNGYVFSPSGHRWIVYKSLLIGLRVSKKARNDGFGETLNNKKTRLIKSKGTSIKTDNATQDG